MSPAGSSCFVIGKAKIRRQLLSRNCKWSTYPSIFLSDRVLIMSSGPGRVISDVTVDLPRPRRPEMIAEPTFADLKRRCMSAIRAESLEAFEQQNR
jgi:hypothetical protein